MVFFKKNPADPRADNSLLTRRQGNSSTPFEEGSKEDRNIASNITRIPYGKKKEEGQTRPPKKVN